MNNLYELSDLTDSQWNNLFNEAIQNGRNKSSSMTEKYYNLGEIDCPEEMLSDIHVKLSDTQGIGKTNWLKSATSGKYIQVNDFAFDSLYEQGKIIESDFDYEEQDAEYQRYCSLSKEDKISYRMTNQGVSKQVATELVYDEFGYSFNYSFEYEITEVTVNTFDNSQNERQYNLTIEADSQGEADVKLFSEIRKEGEIIRTFTKFPQGYKPSMTEIMTGGNLPKHKEYVSSVSVKLINRR